MIIQNSPFYKSNPALKAISETNKDLLLDNEKKTEDINGEDFSFWKWFKGLVNPLQNIPLISGIYSSVNSEDENSDRDLVQNSLGGFLYGGPIGAIAGFGNWVFNKIFDKTPTELALDASGISDIWKDDEKQGGANLIAKAEPQIIRGNEKRIYMQLTGSGDFLRNSQKNNLVLKQKKMDVLVSLNNSKNIKNETQEDLSLAKETTNPEITLQKPEKTIHPIITSQKPSQSDLKNKFVKSANEEAFREINFDYPTWNPENLEIIGKRDFKNPKVKYMDLEDKRLNKSLYNIDA